MYITDIKSPYSLGFQKGCLMQIWLAIQTP